MLKYVTKKDLLDILMHEHYITLGAFVDHVHGDHCDRVFRFFSGDAALTQEIAKRYQYPSVTSFFESVMTEACCKGYLDVVRATRTYFPDTCVKRNGVIGALQQNRLCVVEYLLRETDVPFPLHTFDIDVLKMILATRTFSDDAAAPELQRAAQRGLCDNYELLMRTFPKLRAARKHLDAATVNGNVEMVKLLICKYKMCSSNSIVDSKCIVTATLHVRHCGDKWSEAQRTTLVKEAVTHGQVDMLNLFLSTFANAESPRLLKRAIKYGQDAVVQCLTNSHGFQPDAAMVTLAASKCSYRTLQVLMPYVALSNEQWIAAFKTSKPETMPLFLDERISYNVVSEVAVAAMNKDDVDAIRIILDRRPAMAATLFSMALGHGAYACTKHLVLQHVTLDLSSQNNAFMKLAIKHHDRDLLLMALQDERVRTTLDYPAIITEATHANFNDGVIAFYSVTWIRNKVRVAGFYAYFVKHRMWSQASDVLLNYMDVFDHTLREDTKSVYNLAIQSRNVQLMLRVLQRVKQLPIEGIAVDLAIFTIFDDARVHDAYIQLLSHASKKAVYRCIMNGDNDVLKEFLDDGSSKKRCPKPSVVTLALKHKRIDLLKCMLQYSHVAKHFSSERWAAGSALLWYKLKLSPELLYDLEELLPNTIVCMTWQALLKNDQAYLEKLPRVPWETVQCMYDRAVAVNSKDGMTLWKQYMLDAQPIIKKIKH